MRTSQTQQSDSTTINLSTKTKAPPKRFTDPVYKIYIGKEQQCSCGGGKALGKLCLHIMFIMLKVLKLKSTDPLSWQLELSDMNINQILTTKSRKEKSKEKTTHAFMKRGHGMAMWNSRNSKSNDNIDTAQDQRRNDSSSLSDSSSSPQDHTQQNQYHKRKPLSQDTICSICQDEMSPTQNLWYCMQGCGSNFHTLCFQMYASYHRNENLLQRNNSAVRRRRASANALSCPLCRADWKENPPPVSKILLSGNANDDGKKDEITCSFSSRVNCQRCKVSIRSIFYRCVSCHFDENSSKDNISEKQSLCSTNSTNPSSKLATTLCVKKTKQHNSMMVVPNTTFHRRRPIHDSTIEKENINSINIDTKKKQQQQKNSTSTNTTYDLCKRCFESAGQKVQYHHLRQTNSQHHHQKRPHLFVKGSISNKYPIEYSPALPKLTLTTTVDDSQQRETLIQQLQTRDLSSNDYQLLLSLDDEYQQHSSSVMIDLPHHLLSAFPNVLYPDISLDNNCCAICQSKLYFSSSASSGLSMNTMDSSIRRLTCSQNHMVHESCILMLLMEQAQASFSSSPNNQCHCVKCPSCDEYLFPSLIVLKKKGLTQQQSSSLSPVDDTKSKTSLLPEKTSKILEKENSKAIGKDLCFNGCITGTSTHNLHLHHPSYNNASDISQKIQTNRNNININNRKKQSFQSTTIDDISKNKRETSILKKGPPCFLSTASGTIIASGERREQSQIISRRNKTGQIPLKPQSLQQLRRKEKSPAFSFSSSIEGSVDMNDFIVIQNLNMN